MGKMGQNITLWKSHAAIESNMDYKPMEKKPSNFITKHIGLGVEYDHLHHTNKRN
jgi:hypothetical protein